MPTFFKNDSSIRVLKLVDWLNLVAGYPIGDLKNYSVVLPMIQRGFVWKPHQIIDLWDSLLQGMPIGSLMLSEMPAGESSVDFISKEADSPDIPSQKLALFDGQQRTLAMQLGWDKRKSEDGSHRLWIDLADEPPAGHLFRFRVTTRAQPFGYRRAEPDVRLSMEQRRQAGMAYQKIEPKDWFWKAQPHPDGASVSLCLDMTEVMACFKAHATVESWKEKMYQLLQQCSALTKPHHAESQFTLINAWEKAHQQDTNFKTKIDERLDALWKCLEDLQDADIALLRINDQFFKVDRSSTVEPPLARLFERIGTNATRLSNDDYIYAVLKHMEPEVKTLVDALHTPEQGRHSMASWLSPNDLVMTALRLAATEWKTCEKEPKPETDYAKPSPTQFHKMLWPRDTNLQGTDAASNTISEKRRDSLKKMLGNSNDQVNTLEHIFQQLQSSLEFDPSNNPQGLPAHLFPYLERPLVQVLLRLVQVGYLNPQLPDTQAPSRKQQLISLSLYWLKWVLKSAEASEIAFRVIQQKPSDGDLVNQIIQELVEKDVAHPIASPAMIRQYFNLDEKDNEKPTDKRIKGHSRFQTENQASEESRKVREFYHRWWQPWSHVHPVLLWFQREYVVADKNDPAVHTTDDTPYDYDHILPRAHWSGQWNEMAEKKGKLSKVKDPDAHTVIGNAIGNVRVWYASDNRSDGDDAPLKKMGDDEAKQKQWAKKSAVESQQLDLWRACSPTDPANKSQWSEKRAYAFQSVVEMRTFALYKQMYEELNWDRWVNNQSSDDATVSHP